MTNFKPTYQPDNDTHKSEPTQMQTNQCVDEWRVTFSKSCGDGAMAAETEINKMKYLQIINQMNKSYGLWEII